MGFIFLCIYGLHSTIWAITSGPVGTRGGKNETCPRPVAILALVSSFSAASLLPRPPLCSWASATKSSLGHQISTSTLGLGHMGDHGGRHLHQIWEGRGLREIRATMTLGVGSMSKPSQHVTQRMEWVRARLDQC